MKPKGSGFISFKNADSILKLDGQDGLKMDLELENKYAQFNGDPNQPFVFFFFGRTQINPLKVHLGIPIKPIEALTSSLMDI